MQNLNRLLEFNMKKEPVLSIVMPVYGVEKFISKAIESVLSQSFQDWELLVINDGSKDNSRAIAKEYEMRDDRIVVYDKINGGLSDARNYGLRKARGKYIHFFDSDDWIESDFYSTLFPIAERLKCEVLICGYTVDHEFKSYTKAEGRPCFKGTITQSPLPLPSTISLYFNYAWNKLFLRDFLISNNLLYEKGLFGVEDCVFMSNLINYPVSIIFTKFHGYHYVDRSRQSLSKMFDERIIRFSERRIEALKIIFGKFCNSNNDIGKFIEESQFSTIKRLLNLLYLKSVTMSRFQRKCYLEKISSSPVLSIKKPYKIEYNTLDKILLTILYKKNYFLCDVLFNLKRAIRGRV